MNNKIVLKQLSLNGFRGFSENADIEFNEKLTVLIGNNGSGKSSILDAIALFLMYFRYQITNRELFEFPVRLEKKDKNENVANSKERYDNKLFFELHYTENKQFINHEIGISASAKISTQDNISNFTDFEDPYGVFAGLFNDFLQSVQETKIGDNNNYNLPILVYYGTDFLETKVNFTEEERLHIEHFDTYIDSLEAKDFNFKQFFLLLDKQQKIKLQNPDKQNIFLAAIEKAITFILSDEDTQYENLRIEWGEKYDELLVDKMNTNSKVTLSINQLSSGEKSLIALTADLVRRLYIANLKNSYPLKGHGIVLIDEIDLHLHPKWQRKVVPKLMETFPNIQFVVTTHSPLVLEKVQPQNIRLLENNQIIIPDFHPKGREIGEILEELMNENAVSIQKEVDKYFELISQNKLNEALSYKNDVLLKLTDEENPIFYQAEAMLKMKKLQKI